MKQTINAFLGRLDGTKRACAVFVLCAATAIALPAQTFTTLLSFDVTDGATPYAGLVQATNGNLYGTAELGANQGGGGGLCAPYGCGNVFKITPSGTLTTLYSFCSQGGGAGTFFRITPSGALTTLYNFCSQSGCTDGDVPYGSLVLANNGDFYGTTWFGGANCAPVGCGTIFKITPNGALTTLYSFCPQSGCADGEQPNGLVQATNGDFYGTTQLGGAYNNADGAGGTVFTITPSGALTTLYSFCSGECVDGSFPYAGLVQASNGDFYGTTDFDGAIGFGTVFKITPSGTLTTLYSFGRGRGGINPTTGLVQATDGKLYGTTDFGGANDGGTIFKITPGGTLTTLYNFCSQGGCADGQVPKAALVQDTNGDLYGTAGYGGTNSDGTVFSLSVGLGPFVETQTTSGKVGAAIKILGTDLTGATSVSFNGTAAVFDVVASSLIAAKVPAGATSGKVEVVTPNGTLSSNLAFRVLP
jgi:uncharacterized repeat protein (TIGR03803 family)